MAATVASADSRGTAWKEKEEDATDVDLLVGGDGRRRRSDFSGGSLESPYEILARP